MLRDAGAGDRPQRPRQVASRAAAGADDARSASATTRSAASCASTRCSACGGDRQRDAARRAAPASCNSTIRSTSSSPAAPPARPRAPRSRHHNILNNGYFIGEAHAADRRGPHLHSGAALSLLRHGDGQSRLHHARRGDGLSRARASIRWRRLEAVEAERCTALYGVPTMFIAELDHPEFARFDLSSLRTGIMAGSPCPIEVMKRCIAEMNMREVTIAYGMTETSPVSFQTSHDDPLERRVSHRRPHPSACRGQDRRRRGPHRAAAARRANSARAAIR